MHVFDTFEGLPDPSTEDSGSHFRKGDYSAQYEEVKAYLANVPRLFIHRGYFPETAAPIAEKKFSLVHLDVDLYQPTKDSLEFFYSRMLPGGIIITHDYVNSVGVKKAFDEFFAGRPEIIIEMAGYHALIVKR